MGRSVYHVANRVLGGIVRRAYDVDVVGLERLPATGPAILAPNHRSFMDSIFVTAVVRRPVAFVAKAEYFDRRRTRWLFTGTGQIPLRRGSPASAAEAMSAASMVLDAGGIVGIYPEGTRSRDGRLHRGNVGAARLAMATGAPIVPIGLVGTEAVQEVGRRMPRVGCPVRIAFGDGVVLPAPADVDDPKALLRDATNRLMRDIAELSGQVYVDRFLAVPG